MNKHTGKIIKVNSVDILFTCMCRTKYKIIGVRLYNYHQHDSSPKVHGAEHVDGVEDIGGVENVCGVENVDGGSKIGRIENIGEVRDIGRIENIGGVENINLASFQYSLNSRFTNLFDPPMFEQKHVDTSVGDIEAVSAANISQ